MIFSTLSLSAIALLPLASAFSQGPFGQQGYGQQQYGQQGCGQQGYGQQQQGQQFDQQQCGPQGCGIQGNNPWLEKLFQGNQQSQGFGGMQGGQMGQQSPFGLHSHKHQQSSGSPVERLREWEILYSTLSGQGQGQGGMGSLSSPGGQFGLTLVDIIAIDSLLSSKTCHSSPFEAFIQDRIRRQHGSQGLHGQFQGDCQQQQQCGQQCGQQFGQQGCQDQNIFSHHHVVRPWTKFYLEDQTNSGQRGGMGMGGGQQGMGQQGMSGNQGLLTTSIVLEYQMPIVLVVTDEPNRPPIRLEVLVNGRTVGLTCPNFDQVNNLKQQEPELAGRTYGRFQIPPGRNVVTIIAVDSEQLHGVGGYYKLEKAGHQQFGMGQTGGKW